MPRPHGSTCSCPQQTPDDGLLAYTVDCDHYAELSAVLAKIAARDQTATLRVLTTDRNPANLVALPDKPACDGTMTCPCDNCHADRASRRAAPIRQPWQPRPARKAA